MTGRLPRDLDGPRIVQALLRAGFRVRRQSGSHAVLVHQGDPGRRIVVPIHPGRPLATGTLAEILRQARISPEQLEDLL